MSSAELKAQDAVLSAEPGPDDPVAHAIRKALWEGTQRLVENHAQAQAGVGEGVHRMRTAARRLRSELRLYRGLVEGDWAESLSERLKELGRQLGAVRDLDVLRHRLQTSAGSLASELTPLFAQLDQRHAQAIASLKESLDGAFYHELIRQIEEDELHPIFSDDAWQTCRDTLPALVRKTWKRLRTVGRTLDLSDADEEYHEVRKRAKRARYSAEAAAGLLKSDAARRFARRAASIQDVLGEHQDATVAAREIRRYSAEHPNDGSLNLAAGRLLEREEAAGCEARSRFFKVWSRLDRKKNRRWLKG